MRQESRRNCDLCGVEFGEFELYETTSGKRLCDECFEKWYYKFKPYDTIYFIDLVLYEMAEDLDTVAYFKGKRWRILPRANRSRGCIMETYNARAFWQREEEND